MEEYTDTCCVCKNLIGEDEITVTCKSCTGPYHVTCMGFPCKETINDTNDRRLIDTTEFKTVVDEILDVLSTCAPLMNSEFDACCICESEIGNEISSICEFCNSHFHVSCMQLPCEDKLNDRRLIWICSLCGNNNIAHRMFDQVCIPSHFNRYELLGDHDEHCYLDLNQSRTLSSTTNKRKCGRSKKRYGKKGKKTNRLRGTQHHITDRKTNESDRHNPLATENPFQIEHEEMQNEKFEDDWVIVKSRKTKWVEKLKSRKLYPKSIDDHQTDRKIRRKSVNGKVLEPGVTYIGKAMKTFYESHSRRKKEDRKKVDCKEKVKSEKKNISVQSYTETLLGLYAYSVQSPHAMKLYNDMCMQSETAQTRSWADIASNLPTQSRTDTCVDIDVCTCNLFEQIKDLRKYRVHAGGKKKEAKNKKGQSSKGKKGTDGNHSSDKSEIRFDKDEGIELAIKNEKLDTKKSMNGSDQGLDPNTCKNDEHSDQHICNMKDNKGSDGVVQDDSKNNLLKSNFDENREIETDDDSGSDVHIPVKRSCARNCIESDSDTDTSPGCDLFDRSILPQRNMPLNVSDRPKDMPINEPVDNVCESVLENDDMMKNDFSDVSDGVQEDAVFDNGLKNRSFDTVKDGTDNDTDMSFNDHAHSRNPLESSSDSNIKDEDIEKAIDANMYTCTDETEVEFVADLGLRDRPDKDFKFVPLQNNDKQNICSKLNIRYIGKGCDSRLDRNSSIGVPVQSKQITGDGNCFFRAISYVISGTERNHAILRNATVKHLLQTKDMFSNTLRQEYRTVREYVLKRRIKEDGTWATDTEISALANLIDTDIYSYNDQVPCWQLFSAKKPGRINIVTSDKGIYILYTGNVHFNVVESVDFVNFNSLEQTRTTKEDRTSKRTLPCPSIQADVKVKHVFKKCRSKSQIEEEIDEVVDKSPETFQNHVDPKGKKRRLTLETGTINHDERKGTANLFDVTYEQCASNQSESVVHNERNTKDETLESDHKDKCTRVDTQITLVAQGTFNQGDRRFGHSSGKQCVTNSLSALLYSKVKNANDWKSTDLDRILNNGNELYCYIRRSTSLDNQYLLISDLFEYLDAYNELFNIVCREPVTGLLDGDELILAQSLSMTLKQALEKELCTDSDACFVTFARSTFIVLSGQDGFFIFDSHSRSSRGFLICNGHSVVLRTQSWQGVYKHCMRLAKSMGCPLHTEYEVTSVCAKATSGKNETLKGYPQLQDFVCSQIPLSNRHSESQSGSSGCSIHCESFDEVQILDESVSPQNMIDNPNVFLFPEEANETIIRDVHYNGQKLKLKSVTITLTKLKEPQLNNSCLLKGNDSIKAEYENEQKGDSNRCTKCGNDSDRLNLVNKVQNSNSILSRKRKWSNLESDAKVDVDLGKEIRKSKWVKINENDSLRIDASKCADSNDESIISGKIHVRNVDPGKKTRKNRQSSNQIRKRNRQQMRGKRALAKDEIIKKKEKCLHNAQMRKNKSKNKYRNDLTYKMKKINEVKQRQKENYKTDLFHKINQVAYVKQRQKKMYQEDSNFRNIQLNIMKTKYHSDLHYKKKILYRNKQKYLKNEGFKENVKTVMRTKMKNKYWSDEQFKRMHKSKIRSKYSNNEHFKEKHRNTMKKRIKELYRNDKQFKEKQRDTMKKRIKELYCNNEHFRRMHKKKIRSKYLNNEHFRRMHKYKIRSKYLNNENFKEKQQHTMKKRMKDLYRKDQQFKHIKKANMKILSKIRYKGKEFKEKKLMSLKMKYKKIEKYRQNVIKQNRRRFALRTVKLSEFDIVLEEFRKIISHGPEYVCCVCLKLLFENQVLKCKKSNYKIQTCISEEYLHVCNSECRSKCLIGQSARSSLWICFTCHRKLQAGKVPAEANMNNLQLHEVPKELANLNNLEQHLIALNIPFMKLMALPKGGQNGVHGPVVCVPSNTYETVDMLPRPQTEDQLIRVKLKRKLSYKSYYEYKFVDKSNLLNALQYLKANNKWYFDVTVNDKWENSLERNEKDNEKEEAVEIGGKARLAKYWKEMEEQIDYILSKDKNANENMQDNSKLHKKIDDKDTEDDMEERLRGIQLDSCLQPVDIGQEILDQYFEDIICCAPCEGRSPVSILQDESNEAKCFPVLFPKGQPTFHDRRDEKITLGRYLHNRLMHVDNRFAQNTDYIFYAQYIYEIQQVISQVSIALRQSPNKKDDSSSITASDLKDAEKVKKILKSDKGYKFLKQIRGTPPFWQKTQKDVLAMVRQLGKPTWFASFSSADMRWPELMNTLLRQKGDTRESSELDYTEKCNLLRSNPVTVARMFDKRFHTFMKRVILSPAAPIGKVVDSFWRVEYQARGSPHIHALFWVQNAPQLGIDKDDDVVQFVDKYISCQKPDEKEDRELHEIVSKVQQHSKKHSKSCTKTGKACRFNFPRPPSEKTFIVTPVEEIPAKDCGKVQNKGKDNDQIKASKKIKDDAEKLLKSVKDALSNGIEYNSVNHLFEKLGITQNQFENAHNELASQQSIIIKREIQDVWVNQFNPSLLRSWNANMDLQFVTNVFACVAYIVSYMSKAEREIGMLLSHTLSEMKEGNENAKESMKKLGQVYMQNREVSAQESVYRVCSLRLKECPVGPDPVRMSLPLSVIKSRPDNDNDDDENVWMPSKLDRYKARPRNAEFSDMCLATFCSQYRILTASQKPSTRSKNVFKLDNDLGYIQKRTRTGDAVVRYPRFSPIISPEKYYLSILQLFLPYFEDGQLKPPTFETHEEFYETGSVKICGRELEKVWSIVCTNRKKFEMNADAIDHAQEHLDKFGPHEDAWGLLCPEKEVERLEHPKENVDVEDCDGDLDIPDLKNEPKKDDYSIELRSVKISKQDGHSLMRSLNEKQQSVFYKIRQWCLDRVNGKSVEPFHMFLTGGAGTGKSHLIKCLYYEATRILARMLPHPDDVSVLKMAPTGVAAYNINGHTIHSILSIPINAQVLYQPLSDEKISVLRNKLAELQILIIDEVSMVDQKMMSYIHGRLRQIKQSRDQTAFAGVSVIAVGDMFQLPPVIGTPLYKDTLNGALWNANFKKVELEDIMRQKDDTQFAFLLNRLRVKQGEEILCDEDLAMLKSCETGEECENALHIYACNNEVDAWNKKLLHKKCGDVICVKAQDMDKDVKKGNQIREKPYTKMKTQLPPYLWIAVNARVMLLKNIDVSKGLTNGCFGNVTEIITDHTNLNPVCIKVNFEKADIGIHSIEMSQESIGKKYVRKQFPLKLAYACTIHKVQGSTLDKAVVSLKNIFQSGQAYVGLSRVTSLSGLVIEHFDPKRIYCNPEIKERIEIMKPFIENETSEDIHDYNFSLVLQNVQGLKQHFTDFKSQCQFVNVDCICLTETWINDDDLCDVILDNFQFYHQPRHLSYCNSGVGNVLKEQSHGGVAMYIKNTYSSRLNISVDNLEFIAILVTKPVSVVISVVYRPPSYSIKSFCESLDKLLDALHKRSIRCIVMGDFNEDLFKGSSQVNKLMCNKGYKQHVVNATTEKGTLIDHVYSKGLDLLETEVIPTYYSYHEAVKIAF